jgi:hypothetical protein
MYRARQLLDLQTPSALQEALEIFSQVKNKKGAVLCQALG